MQRVFLSAFLLFAVQCCAPAIHAAVGDVATFKVVNDGSAAAERIVSFGEVFRAGAVLPGTKLTATLNGATAPIQMDWKARYPDGSVRHAVIAVQLPAMARGATLKGVIATADGDGPRSAAVPALAAPNLDVALTFLDGPDKGKTVTVNLPDLARQTTSHIDSPWLKGPLVREQRYYAPMTDGGIQLTFDVWTPAVGPSRVDVVVHNDTAQNPQIDTRTYSVAMTLDGKQIYHVDQVSHYAHSTWHRLVYADSKAPPRVVIDTRALITAGAAPHYGVITPDAGAMEKLFDAARGDDVPLRAAGVTPYMPTTGGRADIGPLPTWAVFYLLDPSRKNQETLLADADAAGAAPWHVRDKRTQGPINIDKYPDVWLDGRGQAVPGILARKYYVSDTKWQPDDAHQPSLTYLPYLLTGSQYYRDELAQQAGYVLLAMDPQYRGHASGFVLGSQIRAVAWDLRTLANAAYILPNADPTQPYFQSKLEGNLREIIRRYVDGHEMDSAGQLEGYLPGPYAVEGATPPWQDNYLAMVLGWIDSMGYKDSRPILRWMTKFTAGLFTNGERGYDPIYGTPYYLYVQFPHSDDMITTWANAFKTTFDPVHHPVTTLDYPDWGGGYAALARGGLASIINATQSPQAVEAYNYVVKQTPRMDANYAQEPTFAITPATPSGG
jgi:hypothetical protein